MYELFHPATDVDVPSISPEANHYDKSGMGGD